MLEAIRLMAEHGVGALLVMRDQQLVGVVLRADYARKVILDRAASSEARPWSGRSASSPVITVRPDRQQWCAYARRSSPIERIRHLPVHAGERVIGVLSTGDLVRAVLEEQKIISELEQYIRSWR